MHKRTSRHVIDYSAPLSALCAVLSISWRRRKWRRTIHHRVSSSSSSLEGVILLCLVSWHRSRTRSAWVSLLMHSSRLYKREKRKQRRRRRRRRNGVETLQRRRWASALGVSSFWYGSKLYRSILFSSLVLLYCTAMAVRRRRRRATIYYD